MAFQHKYNADDVIIRANIVGLVKELNNRIFFENVWEDNRKEIVRIPFYYAMSGDERFLQDYFSNWSDCAPDFIEGNLDPIPRGTVYLTGVSVLAANLTSRYVRGYYTKEIEGELKRFNSYINSIPLQLNFSAEILADTTLDTFKIIQSAISVLYKTLVFSVNFKGFRVPTQAGFPEGYNLNKQFEFSYGNTERLKVTFEIEVQTYLPLPDTKEEFFGGKNIQSVVYSSTADAGGTASTTTLNPSNEPIQSGVDTGTQDPVADNYMNPGEDPLSEDTSEDRDSLFPNKTKGSSPFGPGGIGGNNMDDTSKFGGNYWE